MELRVFRRGHDIIVFYVADVTLTSDDVRVKIAHDAVEGDDDPGMIQAAREAIQRGAEQVLQPRGQGAIIRVSRVVIHPVDFKPFFFKKFTAEALEKLLAEASVDESPSEKE